MFYGGYLHFISVRGHFHHHLPKHSKLLLSIQTRNDIETLISVPITAPLIVIISASATTSRSCAARAAPPRDGLTRRRAHSAPRRRTVSVGRRTDAADSDTRVREIVSVLWCSERGSLVFCGNFDEVDGWIIGAFRGLVFRWV